MALFLAFSYIILSKYSRSCIFFLRATSLSFLISSYNLLTILTSSARLSCASFFFFSWFFISYASRSFFSWAIFRKISAYLSASFLSKSFKCSFYALCHYPSSSLSFSLLTYFYSAYLSSYSFMSRFLSASLDIIAFYSS